MGHNTTQPSQHQAEALMQIGGYLHEVREKKLLSLEQISAQTMISARLLRAIETADFQQLPEPIYIRGFIRRYAEVLGLDGNDVASQFPVNMEERTIQPSWSKSTSQLRPTHLWVAYTVIIVAAIGGLHQYLTRFSSPANQSVNTEATLESSSNESVEPSESAPSDTLSSTDSSSSTQPPTTQNPLIIPDSPEENSEPDAPLEVSIELTQRSWLRVVVDGEQELEEVLPEGTQRSWTGEQEITIRAGNAGGVLLTQGDDDAKPMGDPGAVTEVTFSVDDPESSAQDATTNTSTADATSTLAPPTVPQATSQ